MEAVIPEGYLREGGACEGLVALWWAAGVSGKGIKCVLRCSCWCGAVVFSAVGSGALFCVPSSICLDAINRIFAEEGFKAACGVDKF